MPRPAPLFAAALAAGLVLTACQKPEVSGPPVSPTALPSSTPTAPSVGTTAPTAASRPASPSPVLITWKPTTKAEEEALAKEAEQVYFKYLTERSRLEASGGVEGSLPPTMSELVSGPEAIRLKAILNAVHAQKRATHAPQRLEAYRQEVSTKTGTTGSLIRVTFCVTSKSAMDGASTDPATLETSAEFARQGTALRVHNASEKQVEKCP